MNEEVVIAYTHVIGPANTLDEINSMISQEVLCSTELIPATRTGVLMSVSHSILDQKVGSENKLFASLILTYRS